MGRQNNKIKLSLFLLFITCVLAIICLHYKHSHENGLASIENVNCPCAPEDKTRIIAQGEAFPLSSSDKTDARDCPSSPSSTIEQTRRHISETSRHQWLFLRSQIRFLQKSLSFDFKMNLQNPRKYEIMLKYMLDHVSDYSRVIDLELEKLASLDGWDSWRKEESAMLRTIVRNRLTRLQNPRSCNDSRVLVCNLTNPFGFASGVHDVLWCFIKAYSKQRRLVLETSHWHYAPSGWETVFRPLSDVCQNDNDELKKESSWPGRNDNKARWLMRTLPQDLGPRLIRLHGNPLAWWYGQFIWYLMRPNEQLQSFINTTLENMHFSKGIVGIHIRRTDKVGNEAKAHRLEEYMEQAEGYFQRLELISLKSIKRRVYIATDEPSVLKECHRKYPHYECLYNRGSAEMAKNMDTRYNNQSFWYLMTDIFTLAQTDFIVCTMSSGICRVVYELKLALDENSADASAIVSSLDIPHHYAWVSPASRKALYNHKSKSLKEISFTRGDVLAHRHDHTTVFAAAKGKVLDGFTKLINCRINKEGLVPIYKTREMFQMINITTEFEDDELF